MIEYLDENFELRVVDGENEAAPESWILVPEGAIELTKGINDLVFWSNGYKACFNYTRRKYWANCDGISACTFDQYCITNPVYKILWQRDKDQKMKEWLLRTEDGKYYFHRDDMDFHPHYVEKIEIPEEAIEARLNNNGTINFINKDGGFKNPCTNGMWFTYTQKHDDHKLIWQRKDDSVVDADFFEDEKKHSHYFKDVSHLDHVDVYRVLELFGVREHAIGHAIKKLLVAGNRGSKNQPQDIQEAIDTLVRYQEMQKEDQK